jgi:hypothetical protein
MPLDYMFSEQSNKEVRAEDKPYEYTGAARPNMKLLTTYKKGSLWKPVVVPETVKCCRINEKAKVSELANVRIDPPVCLRHLQPRPCREAFAEAHTIDGSGWIGPLRKGVWAEKRGIGESSDKTEGRSGNF